MSEKDNDSPGVSRRTVLAGAATTTAVLAAGVSAQEPVADRGSDKWMDKIGPRGHTIPAEELREVASVLSKQGKLIDWCPYGQPDVDGVCGTSVVDFRVAPSIVSELLKIRNLSNWRVGLFPKGIPIPTELHVQVVGGRAAGVVIIHG